MKVSDAKVKLSRSNGVVFQAKRWLGWSLLGHKIPNNGSYCYTTTLVDINHIVVSKCTQSKQCDQKTIPSNVGSISVRAAFEVILVISS